MKNTILILSLILASFAPSKAQEIINKIEVTGEAEIEVVPDILDINISLQEYIKADGTKMEIEVLEKSLVKSFEEMGFEKDRLTIMSVQANKQYSADNKPTNFLESRVYTLKLNSVNDINSLIPKLDRMGVLSIYMGRKANKNKSELERELRKQAIKDAKDKATLIAESVDKKIGDIILIRENNNSDFFPIMGYGNLSGLQPQYKKQQEQSGFKTTIAVEKIKISYRVIITFQMK